MGWRIVGRTNLNKGALILLFNNEVNFLFAYALHFI